MTLLEKARMGRQAALASLAEKNDDTTSVVSIFDFASERDKRRQPAPIPSFHSIRSHGSVVKIAA
ncbi:hypothetical protein [Maritimibacter sp. DP1N21-5]|uniref:hypothetical protein n=1 Tax=Maritimibacter sp. DP1N21-5 TaxID=2836867 RepID=UPI001C46C11F|nr:hypothetical protein [Maritimibacter sp. DP1N21-5]MBV7407585.1 hypothetical protein [Maritimibacter sp. DP1N21-5]